MSTFRYEVAISFAGEQRREAEQLARCLRSNGVSVFFDEFEDAQLWGKDLFIHLSNVYSKQAHYCIIFASSAYAQKAWTTHERQSAQARALQEKGNEYILPVRFDETPIPGLMPTIGYLDIRQYGVEGICNAFIRKLKGDQIDGGGDVSSEICSTSSFAAIFNSDEGVLSYVRALRSSFSRDKVQLVVAPMDSDEERHLNSLKRVEKIVVVAFKQDVAVCRPTNVLFRTDGGVGQFELEFDVRETEFIPSLEPGLSGTSKDELAEFRAKRLLLNEYPAKDRPDVNEVMREILVAGQGTLAEIKKSRFPALYAAYGTNRRQFLEIAWIDAVMQLKVSACVSTIGMLSLALMDSSLAVNFRGWRRKEYADRSPYEIKIQGTLTLA